MIDPRQRRGVRPAATVFLLGVLAGSCRGPIEEADGWCKGVPALAIDLPALDLEAPGVSRRNLLAWVELLTAPDLRGRHAGDPGADVVAGLLAAEMNRLGLAPARSGSGHCRSFPLHEGEDNNVLGYLPAEPEEGERAILLSAHYDGQGVHPAGMIYPGADDNASGTAALLEVARLAARRAGDARTTLIFAAFGAEEVGRLGARSLLADLAASRIRIDLAVNLDMVGRPYPGEAREAIGYLVPGGPPASILADLEAAALGQGIEIRPLESLGEQRPAISDAHELASRLPTLLLSTALHEDHHQLTDTPEKIDYGQVERAARLVLELADIAPKGREGNILRRPP